MVPTMTGGERLHPTPQDAMQPQFIVDFSAIPVRQKELRERASSIATILVEDPTLLPSFFQQVDEAAIAAQDKRATAQMRIFTTAIADNIKSYDWTTRQDTPLSQDAAKTMLLYLPEPGKRRARKTPQEQTVENITKGYFQDRFRGKERPDWRGSLRSMQTFLHAAVLHPEVDVQALNTWIDLMTGKYEGIAPSGSLPRRAAYIGYRAADPKDQEYIYIAAEMRDAVLTASHYLHRPEDYTQYYMDNIRTSIHFDTAIRMIKGALEHGTTLDRKSANSTYQSLIRDMIHNSEYRQFYGAFDIAQMLKIPIPLDVFEVATGNARNPERDKLIFQFVEEDYTQPTRIHSLVGQRPVPSVNGEVQILFPVDIIIRKKESITKIMDLFDKERTVETVRTWVRDHAQTRGPGWHPTPFALGDLQGYVVWQDDSATAAEEVERIREVLATYTIEERWTMDSPQIGDSAIGSLIYHHENADFILTNPEWSAKSQLETLLDTKIPEELREKAFDILAANNRLQRDLPDRFRRIPTMAGDFYRLADHTDLPGVIKDATIYKQEDGSLGFSLSLFGDTIIMPDTNSPIVAGTINFSSLRTNISFNDETPHLAPDHHWIFQSVVLSLVEKSCCPPLSEIAREQERIQNAGQRESYPGYVGHVGGWKIRDDELVRKEFTQEAANNYLAAMKALWKDVTGISLARVNERSREINPEDDRFLTYTQGKDVAGSLSFQKESPEHILLAA